MITHTPSVATVGALLKSSKVDTRQSTEDDHCSGHLVEALAFDSFIFFTKHTIFPHIRRSTYKVTRSLMLKKTCKI